MKVKHLLSVALATCSLLTSCLSEPDFTPVVEDGIPINLDGSISQVSTKVNAQGFEDKDALGLYAVNYENSNQTPGILLDKGNQADHVKYIFDESTWKWTPVRPVYYKDVNTNVDLYVFYPHAEPSSVNAYNFEVQKDQSQAEKSGRLSGYEASDFMWTKVENVTPTESAVKVTLQHKMAGVHVILQEGTGFEVAGDWDLLDKKVLVTNTTRKAVVDLSTGEVSPLGGAQATGIVMAPQTDGSFRAIVVPQTVQAGTPVLNITVGGVSYNFTKDASVTYTSGKLSQFTITVNRKTAAGDYEFVLTDTQIVDWKEDINTHEGEARQYYCVHVEEPGTLGDLIVADGKNPDKIKNLKVSGVISDEDFYFMRDNMDILEAVNLKESTVKDVFCSDLSIRGYDDINGNNTIFRYRESGVYDDVIPDDAFVNKRTLNYFTFPENITDIGANAFKNTSLNGALILPENVVNIWLYAFESTNISSLSLSGNVEVIADAAFANCTSLTGVLYLPDLLLYIGQAAFYNCAFTGNLILPNSLSFIGGAENVQSIQEGAFSKAGQFTGDLRIPDNITILEKATFRSFVNNNFPFTGTLDLNNVQSIGTQCFYGTRFSGELVIPEGVTDIPDQCFFNNYGGKLTSIILPTSIKTIGAEAFAKMERMTDLYMPEGLHTIKVEAFSGCSTLQSLEFPSTIQTIQANAFNGAYSIGSIVLHATIPPTVMGGAFDGVPKANFTVEVPEGSVKLYQADRIWGEFTRISAHHDFSISRSLARALNAETSKTYTLRVPSGLEWSIESNPDWITVTPSSGTGRTEVTVTFAEIGEGDIGTFEYELTDQWGNLRGTATYDGRAGEIVFLLDDKDYRSTMTVEQYDYEYGDGDVLTLHEATKGNGVDLVFLADCYDAKDIADGSYLADIEEAYGYYFDVEPYKTYKDYFNVYAVFGESNDSGMGTVNTIRDAKFGSQYSLDGISPDFEICYEYAAKADPGIAPSQTLIVMIENTTEYGGICYMWGDGSAIACCPKSADAYPYDFRGIVQHEAGGHGFGKLADEYIYHNAFIQSCGCACCNHLDELLDAKARGWYRNIDITADVHAVGWSHLIFHPDYSNVVDIYEGGYFHTRGVYRSEQVSCMNNNIPYYSAISRQAIVERIMDYAGEDFTLENFYAYDSDEFGPTTRSADFNTIHVETYFNGQQHAPVYMGDKPEFLK